MKRQFRKYLSVLLVFTMLFALAIPAFATDYYDTDAYDDISYNGVSGIQPNDRIRVPPTTLWVTLTAVWKVQVNFYDGKDFGSPLIRDYTVEEGGSVGIPSVPYHENYRFTGWKRIDSSEGTAVMDASAVGNVYGPGPISYQATYDHVLNDGQINGSVTVLNTTHDHTYEGYRIFNAEINPGNADAIIYTIREDSPWYAFVQDYFTLTELRKDGDDKTVYKAEAKDGFDPKTFFENLPTDGIEPDLEAKTPERDGVVTWYDVSFGYYAITSTLGTWVTVNTNNPNVVVIDKNQAAVIDKNIVTADGKTKTGSASFGEHVNFDIDLYASDYKANELVTYYHITDTISDGFDYDFTYSKKGNYTGGLTVKVNGTQSPEYEYTLSRVGSLAKLQNAKSGYYVSYTPGSRSFEIIVKWAALNGAGELMPIYEDEFNHLHVTYSATVNDSAVIAGSGNPNTASFTYDKTSGFDPEYPPREEPPVGTNPEDPNTPVTTTTYVYALGIEKVDKADHTIHLPGVKFTTADFRAKKLSEGVYEVIPAEIDDTEEPTAEYAEYFEVPESGFILIKGLGAGEYTFHESETLPGYNLLAEPLVITIPASGETVGTVAETPCAAISTVENSTGIELPSTGGIGTTVFTVFGMIAMLGAGILLITNKRITKEEQ